MSGFLYSAFIFLTAAVVFVPVSKKLGFGAVLGYLVAGIVIGPNAAGLVTNVDDMLHFSEFGVVLLLFIIGLELEPKKLWQLRTSIFGLGLAQVVGCIAVFAGIGLAFGWSWQSALVLGMGFALSSTALVMQLLEEKNIDKTESGKKSFAVLLFQDMAVIPMIAVLPLLGLSGAGGETNDPHGTYKLLGMIAAVLFARQFLMHKIFQWIAGIHVRELFTALSLLLVVGMALAMHELHLSMGLGAFLAGVLLANSEYKHALEADIEPFKGLFLGLFFISVGMTVPLAEIAARPAVIAGAVLGAILVKTLIHYALARAIGLPKNQAPFFSLALAQVGEFAFVLFGAAEQVGVLSAADRGFFVTVSALSFAGSAIVIMVYEKFFSARFEGAAEIPPDEIESDHAPVIIAGFGRVGQIVGRFLFANGIKATVLDFEAEQVESLRRFGFKVFYGDATREDLLEAAGAHEAKVLVVAIDDVESSVKLVDVAQKYFPHLKLVCRARNVAHVFQLRERGVEILERETFDGSLRLGRSVLELFGMERYQAYVLSQKFRAYDLQMMDALGAGRTDETTRISLAKQARADIEELFAAEDTRVRTNNEDGWAAYEDRES